MGIYSACAISLQATDYAYMHTYTHTPRTHTGIGCSKVLNHHVDMGRSSADPVHPAPMLSHLWKDCIMQEVALCIKQKVSASELEQHDCCSKISYSWELQGKSFE